MLKLKGLKGQTDNVKNHLRVLSSGLLLFFSLLIPAYSLSPALAATASNIGNGFRISPPRYEITVPQGTSQTVSVFLENVANLPVSAHAIVNDFVAGDNETGEPALILDPNKSAPDHSFKPLVQNIPDVSLAPLERKEVRVTISVPANDSPGGYYGAIRFIPANTVGSGNVTLTASVGTLFLVTVPGNLTQKLAIASFNVSKNGTTGTLFNTGPVTVVTRLRNEGNIHVAPFGNIVVKNTFGKIVAVTPINNTDPRGNVLPGSIRRFENPLNIKHMFGRYTVLGNFAYGDNGDIVGAKAVFYVIPYVFLLIVIAVLLFVIFALPRLIRWYNRRVLERARQQNNLQR